MNNYGSETKSNNGEDGSKRKPLHRLQEKNTRNKHGKDLLVNEVIDKEKHKIK